MSPISQVPSAAALSSAIGSGLALIAAGGQQLSQDAAQIANPAGGDLIAPLADLSQAELLAEAGAAVIKATDRMLGSLIDTHA